MTVYTQKRIELDRDDEEILSEACEILYKLADAGVEEAEAAWNELRSWNNWAFVIEDEG